MPKDIGTVAAFDLSLTGTGFAEFSRWKSKLDTQTIETLAPPKKMIGMERLDWILNQVSSRVTEVSTDLIVFEDLAFGARDLNHQRAGLATMIRHMLWKRGLLPYI